MAIERKYNHMKDIKLLCTILLLITWSNIFAQKSVLEAKFDTLDLNGQFEYVFKNSETYERYKVVKISTFNLLMKNSVDSIGEYKTRLITQNKEIAQLQSTVSDKDNKIKELSKNLTATSESRNSMEFLGLEVSKTIYNTIMWCIVLGLTVIVVVVFLMYKRSHAVTNETKHRLAEIEDEYEAHRKSALKREQKIARELMDEKLKHKF